MSAAWQQKLRPWRGHGLGLLVSLCALGLGYGLAVLWLGEPHWPVAAQAVVPAPKAAGPSAAASRPRGSASAGPLTAAATAPARSPSGALAQVRIWEAAPALAASSSDKPLTPELWKITGVFASAQGLQAIVEFPRERNSLYLKAGDALPNGAQIVAVQATSVTVRTKVANQWKTIVLDL